MLVPVVDLAGTPLQPACVVKVRRWIKEQRCTKHFHRGTFYVKLNKVVKYPNVDIILGIDPGSKRTAFTVSTRKDIVLNWMINSENQIKQKIEKRAMYRRQRRYRNTPYRKCKFNKISICKEGRLPPSTRSRWNNHLRLINNLLKILPITKIIIEDINAVTHNSKKKRLVNKHYVSQWNILFSPLQQGKNYFYNFLEDHGIAVYKRKGWQTFNHRKKHCYNKIKDKLSTKWASQCIDSHSLCEMYYNKKIRPQKQLYFIEFLNFSRRELYCNHGKIRKRQGSTRTLGFNRGSLMYCNYTVRGKFKPIGLCYLSGYTNDRVSLYSLAGKRLGQNFNLSSCKLLTNLRYLTKFVSNKLPDFNM